MQNLKVILGVLNQMTCVQERCREKRRSRVKTEAETGVMQPQATELPEEAGRIDLAKRVSWVWPPCRIAGQSRCPRAQVAGGALGLAPSAGERDCPCDFYSESTALREVRCFWAFLAGLGTCPRAGQGDSPGTRPLCGRHEGTSAGGARLGPLHVQSSPWPQVGVSQVLAMAGFPAAFL